VTALDVVWALRGQCQAGISPENQENQVMRRFFPLTLVLLASFVVLWAQGAWAAPREKASAKSQVTRSTDEAKAAPAKDPNYRFFNGQWWYWMPAQKNWMVWTGDKWVPFRRQASRGAVRSFSYDDQAQFSGQRVYGTPFTSMPDTVANQRIIGSYGFHSAGSKAMGNY
jgi:hypothetical protein